MGATKGIGYALQAIAVQSAKARTLSHDGAKAAEQRLVGLGNGSDQRLLEGR